MFQFAVGAPAARPATPPGARARPPSVPTGAEGRRFASVADLAARPRKRGEWDCSRSIAGGRRPAPS